MKKRKNIIYNLLLTICLIVFSYSAYRLIAYYFEYKSMNEVYQNISDNVVGEFKFNINSDDLLADAPEIDMNELYNINNEVCGYVLIPDTDISYPIVYSSDELKYLNYDIYNNKSRSGAIFVEPSDDPNFEDLSTIIHGHNMIDDSMFGQLNEYVDDEQFFKDHPYIYIYSNKYIYLYRIFSVDTIEDGSPIYRLSFSSNNSMMEYINERISESEFEPEIKPTETERTVTLSTCSNYGETKRTIVQAYQVAKKER